MGKRKRYYKLVVAFEDKDAMLDFAEEAFPNAVVYHADQLDKEFGGRPPSDSFVLRSPGGKPAGFAARLSKIGANA